MLPYIARHSLVDAEALGIPRALNHFHGGTIAVNNGKDVEGDNKYPFFCHWTHVCILIYESSSTNKVSTASCVN